MSAGAAEGIKRQERNEAKIRDLGQKSIPKLITGYSLTTLAALLLHSVYSLTDALFVSWGVGTDAMGSISLAFPFIIIQSAVSTALGGGAASLISRKIGEKKYEEGGGIAFNAMLTFWITAAVTTAAGLILLDPLLNALGATPELYSEAKNYLIIILIGNIFSTGFSSIIRAEGKMLYGLLIWVIPISVNIVLDALFVLVLKWGVKGSAWATVICQIVSFSMSILFFIKFSSLKFKGARLKLKTIGGIFAIGLPSLVQQGSNAIILIIMNNVLKNMGGSLAINTYAYINKIYVFAIIAFTAVAQALAPVAGYNYGAGNTVRVKKALRFSIFLASGYAVLALSLTEAVPGFILRLFTNDKDILDSGVKALRIIMVSMLFMPLPLLSGAFFQATGKKAAAWVMYSANLVFFIPSAFLLSHYFQTVGAWWALPLSAALSFLTALLVNCLFSLRRRQKLKQA